MSGEQCIHSLFDIVSYCLQLLELNDLPKFWSIEDNEESFVFTALWGCGIEVDCMERSDHELAIESAMHSVKAKLYGLYSILLQTVEILGYDDCWRSWNMRGFNGRFRCKSVWDKQMEGDVKLRDEKENGFFNSPNLIFKILGFSLESLGVTTQKFWLLEEKNFKLKFTSSWQWHKNPNSKQSPRDIKFNGKLGEIFKVLKHSISVLKLKETPDMWKFEFGNRSLQFTLLWSHVPGANDDIDLCENNVSSRKADSDLESSYEFIEDTQNGLYNSREDEAKDRPNGSLTFTNSYGVSEAIQNSELNSSLSQKLSTNIGSLHSYGNNEDTVTHSSVSDEIENEVAEHESMRGQGVDSQYSQSIDTSRRSVDRYSDGVTEKDFDDNIQKKSDILSWLGLVSDPTLQEKFVFEVDTKVKSEKQELCHGKEYEDAENSECIDSYMKLSFESGIELDDVLQSDVGRLNRRQLNIPSIYVVDLSDNTHEDTVVVSLIDDYDRVGDEYRDDRIEILNCNEVVMEDRNTSVLRATSLNSVVTSKETNQVESIPLSDVGYRKLETERLNQQSLYLIDSGVASQTSHASQNEADGTKSRSVGEYIGESDTLSSISKTSFNASASIEQYTTVTDGIDNRSVEVADRSFSVYAPVKTEDQLHTTRFSTVHADSKKTIDKVSFSEDFAPGNSTACQPSLPKAVYSAVEDQRLRYLPQGYVEGVDKKEQGQELPEGGLLPTDQTHEKLGTAQADETKLLDSDVTPAHHTYTEAQTCNVVKETKLPSVPQYCSTASETGVIRECTSSHFAGLDDVVMRSTRESTAGSKQVLELSSNRNSGVKTGSDDDVDAVKRDTDQGLHDNTYVRNVLQKVQRITSSSQQVQLQGDNSLTDTEAGNENSTSGLSNVYINAEVTARNGESEIDSTVLNNLTDGNSAGTLSSSHTACSESAIDRTVDALTDVAKLQEKKTDAQMLSVEGICDSTKLSYDISPPRTTLSNEGQASGDEGDVSDEYKQMAGKDYERHCKMTTANNPPAISCSHNNATIQQCGKASKEISLFGDLHVSKDNTGTKIKPHGETHEAVEMSDNDTKLLITDDALASMTQSFTNINTLTRTYPVNSPLRDDQASPALPANGSSATAPLTKTADSLVGMAMSGSDNITSFSSDLRTPDGSSVSSDKTYIEMPHSGDEAFGSGTIKLDAEYIAELDSCLHTDEIQFICGPSDRNLNNVSSDSVAVEQTEACDGVNSNQTYLFCCSVKDSASVHSALGGLSVHAGSQVVIGTDTYKVLEIQENSVSFPSLLTNLTDIGKRITLIKPTREGKDVKNSWESLCFWNTSISYHPDESLLDEATDVMVTSSFERELVIGSRLLKALHTVTTADCTSLVLVTNLPDNDQFIQWKTTQRKDSACINSSPNFVEEDTKNDYRHVEASSTDVGLKEESYMSEWSSIDVNNGSDLVESPSNAFRQMFPSLQYKRYLLHLPRLENEDKNYSVGDISPQSDHDVEKPNHDTSYTNVHTNDLKCLRNSGITTNAGGESSSSEEYTPQVPNARDSSSFCLHCGSWSCLSGLNYENDTDPASLPVHVQNNLTSHDTDSLSSGSDSSSLTLMWDASTQTLIPAKRTPTGSKIPRYVPLSKRKKVRLFSKYLHQDLTLLHPPLPGSPGGNKVYIPENYSYMPSAKILKRLHSDSDVSYDYNLAWDMESRYRTYRRNSYDREKMRQMVGMYSHYVEEFNLYRSLIQSEQKRDEEALVKNEVDRNEEPKHGLITAGKEERKNEESLPSPRSILSWSSETSLASDGTYDIKEEPASELINHRPVVTVANTRYSNGGIHDASALIEHSEGESLSLNTRFTDVPFNVDRREMRIPEIFVTEVDELNLLHDLNGNEEFNDHTMAQVISALFDQEEGRRKVDDEELMYSATKRREKGTIVTKQRRNSDERGTLVRRRVFVHKKTYLLYKLEVLRRLKTSFSHARDIYQLMHFITGDYVDRIWPPTKCLLLDLSMNKKYNRKRLGRKSRRNLITWPRTAEESKIESNIEGCGV